ncbi:PREDICTED: mini-chromosome maintenance complex-binding protein [Colobus angolensis palliatus]|uniref:mini-chromosome maintenance complex-binding protein n=1 Tax=Colobus angolensis palliatus TaxID=336983 RepID=UPI0005F39718|nr:PREDICTED: mini-chromosome maintenance complex-binding protein [Colobus angolensis palliatus]
MFAVQETNPQVLEKTVLGGHVSGVGSFQWVLGLADFKNEALDLHAQNGVNPDWEKKVIEYFKEKLKENNAPKWVPSLNEVPLHYLKPNSFVKFRCMIQDMFDPEFYMGVYETVNQNTKAHVLHFGKYRDVAECGPQQELDLNSPRNTTLERQTFYCVPVPGESTWVKEAYVNANQARVSPSTSYTPSRHKRSYEDDDDMDLQPNKQKDQHAGARQAGSVGGLQWCGEPKRLETEASTGQQLNSLNFSSPFDLNFPLPGEKGPACLVKVYEDWDCFKVNDILELYGILSVDPVLSILNNDERDASALLDPMECTDTAEEQRVHSPPASLVPRIHVILAQKLQHINPLLPACLNKEESKTFVSSFMSELSPVRAELLGFLTHALLGDSLAAEYLILHLISTVYTRRDVLPLGKFTVNLSGCPRNSTFTEHLYRIIQHLVPASFRLQMTIENMNHLKFIPHKDYTANRLVSGLLQLPSNTSLVIDETLLEQGQLDTPGTYIDVSLPFLTSFPLKNSENTVYFFSFQADCQIHLQPQLIPPNMEEYMNSLLSAVLPSVLNKFRIYLTLLRFLEYSISDEITKAVEDDFVEMRKNDPQSITADDLHQLLVVARCLSLSAGQTTLSRERWLRAKQLESLRRTRLQQQKCVNGNEL